MLKNPVKKINSAQKTTTKIKNIRESINKNPDAWLLDYASIILDLVAQQEAVQFTDDLMTNDEANNCCVRDYAYQKSQELNQAINHQLGDMARYQAFTMAGLQAKARAFKAVTSPLEFDEGFLSYDANLLLTSLLMDLLGGVRQ